MSPKEPKVSINYASLHKPDLLAAIEKADAKTLTQIDADLAREGWTPDGVVRSLIAAHLSEHAAGKKK